MKTDHDQDHDRAEIAQGEAGLGRARIGGMRDGVTAMRAFARPGRPKRRQAGFLTSHLKPSVRHNASCCVPV
jgi:hypothetical protein